MDRINLLKKLTAAPGLSAAESGIAAVLQSELERLGLKAHIDSFGNVHAVMPSERKTQRRFCWRRTWIRSALWCPR